MVSMLVAHNIPYYVQNRGFGGLYPGMQMPLYNVQRVMVPLAYSEESMNLFSAFQDSYEASFTYEKLAVRDRLRGIAEILLGGWTVPFKYRKCSPASEESENA